MRVAINLLSENPNQPSGAMQFWQHVISEMSEILDPQEELVLYVSRSSRNHFDESLKGVKYKIFPWSNEARILRVMSEYILIPIYSLLEKIDVLNTGITTFFNSCKLVVHIKTMHAYTTPSELPWITRLYRRLSYPRSVRAADAVIINSLSLQSEVRKYIPASKGKLRLVYEAVDHDLFRPADNKNIPRRFIADYGIQEPYVLFLSSLWRYKNFDGLLRAWVKARTSLGGYKLVVVGFRRDMEYAQEIDTLVRELDLESDVIFCGGVDHKDTVHFYQCAELFVYPSFNETFGLTILESMACGCPVVTSNTTSMPEIAGGAALLVDPHNTDDLAEKIVKGLDVNMREKLVEKGFARAAEFSWRSTAEQTLNIYRDVYRSATNGKIM